MFVLIFVCWYSNCRYWSGFTPCFLPLLLYALYWFQCQNIYRHWLKLFVMLINSLTNVYFVSCDPTLAWWYIEAKTKNAAILPMTFNSFSRVKCLQLFIYHIFPVVELFVLVQIMPWCLIGDKPLSALITSYFNDVSLGFTILFTNALYCSVICKN